MSAYDRTTCKCNNEIFLDYKLISLHFNCIYVSFYIADLPFLDLTSPRQIIETITYKKNFRRVFLCNSCHLQLNGRILFKLNLANDCFVSFFETCKLTHHMFSRIHELQFFTKCLTNQNELNLHLRLRLQIFCFISFKAGLFKSKMY